MRADLIARYADERLPRYTSYPTAPHFAAEVGSATYGGWLEALPGDVAASLYLHVPFCRRMCWYCGCNTAVSLRDEPISTYADALLAEIAMVRARLGREIALAHVHFGGGTPTIVAPDDFARITAAIDAAFRLRPEAEIAIEIDPRVLTGEMAAMLGRCGVNRASLGVQSLDPAVQAAINRKQSFDETALAVDRLCAAGIAGINIDLIYGLPLQTVASCLETVDACLTLRPDRFAVFGYAHVPTFKKHQRRINAATLPAGQDRHRQAEAIAGRLVATGYRQIGLDHFALPTDAMAIAADEGRLHRNFQGYTTDPAAALIGLGASAIGKLPQGYVQNEVVTRTYLSAIHEGRLATAKGFALGGDDRLRAALIERVMCDFRVDIDAVCRGYGVTADHVADAWPELERLAAEGAIHREGSVLEVAPDARALVRVVAASFDAYRKTSARPHSPAL